MRIIYLLLLSVLLLLVSCTSIDKELGDLSRVQDSGIHRFHATTEGYAPETKVYADEDLMVLWNAGDHISIFNKSTYNSEYEFTGEDGDNAGDFDYIPPSGFISGNPLSNIYAVYPYARTNKINNTGTQVTLTMPAEQQYKEHSFGIGANPMIAVTDNNFLAFKNVGGYLQLRLYGDNVKVSRITIQGNNGEKIAGKAAVAIGLGTAPVVTMDATATDAITIVCDEPVQIGTSAEDYTDFWFVIPPTTFSNGFKITVTDELGGTYEKSTTKSLTIVRSQMEYMKALQVTPSYNITANKYLTFSSEGTSTISLNNFGGNSPLLYYSYDKTNWTQWDYAELTFTSNEPLYLYGNNPNGFSITNAVYSRFISTGSNYHVSGSIMSLLSRQENSVAIPCAYCFYRLFQNCTNLTSAPELPATSLTDHCYQNMFAGCSGLTSAPVLPATSMVNSCYYRMFSGCSNLATAPELPATTLANSCYHNMFDGCSNLVVAPELPATHLEMYCYGDMFSVCTKLTTAPALPATELAQGCYDGMFHSCTSLTSAPELPATSLEPYCYSEMFYGCTSLTSAPALPACILAQSCYERMFINCKNLSYVKCLATDISAKQCVSSWLDYVSSNGVFDKSTSMRSWPKGSNGIPEGWTILNDGAAIPSIEVLLNDIKNLIDPWGSTYSYYDQVDNSSFSGPIVLYQYTGPRRATKVNSTSFILEDASNYYFESDVIPSVTIAPTSADSLNVLYSIGDFFYSIAEINSDAVPYLKFIDSDDWGLTYTLHQIRADMITYDGLQMQPTNAYLRAKGFRKLSTYDNKGTDTIESIPEVQRYYDAFSNIIDLFLHFIGKGELNQSLYNDDDEQYSINQIYN